MVEGWETNLEASGTESAVAEVSSVVSRSWGSNDGRNNGGGSVGACPVETIVSSVLADSDHGLLGEEALKAGGSLGDSEEESESEGRFHVG